MTIKVVVAQNSFKKKKQKSEQKISAIAKLDRRHEYTQRGASRNKHSLKESLAYSTSFLVDENKNICLDGEAMSRLRPCTKRLNVD